MREEHAPRSIFRRPSVARVIEPRLDRPLELDRAAEAFEHTDDLSHRRKATRRQERHRVGQAHRSAGSAKRRLEHVRALDVAPVDVERLDRMERERSTLLGVEDGREHRT
jgi:hypothetical protein